jgi:hypothetical protein
MSEERMRQAPLATMFSRTLIESDARSTAIPDHGPEREEALDDHDFARDVMMRATLAESSLRILREQGRWNADLIVAAITDADEGFGEACAPGVRAYEVSDHWGAIHVLVPQIERALHIVGRHANVTMMSRRNHRLQWISIEDLLKDPQMVNVLGASLAREISAVFASPYGPNIRNNVAHGAINLDPGSATATIVLFTVLTLSEVLAGFAER